MATMHLKQYQNLIWHNEVVVKETVSRLSPWMYVRTEVQCMNALKVFICAQICICVFVHIMHVYTFCNHA